MLVSQLFIAYIVTEIFPADCPRFKIFTAENEFWIQSRRVLEDTRGFQHMARFICVTTTIMSIVTTDIHEGLQQSPCNLATTQRRCLTFSHWSSVTPYTFSYEFAGSCVFVKQLPEILSLRPILLWASLIPKLRLLFCRVPWRPLTRSPWSTRPDHLCRFAVRIAWT